MSSAASVPVKNELLRNVICARLRTRREISKLLAVDVYSKSIDRIKQMTTYALIIKEKSVNQQFNHP